MIPDFVPSLRGGTGETPADGGCLVQVASYLADGHSWSDRTPCVHHVLRESAIDLNDALSDEDRQRILIFAPRLIGTATDSDDDDEAIAHHLATWAVYRAREVIGANVTRWVHGMIDTMDTYYSQRFEPDLSPYWLLVKLGLAVEYAGEAIGVAACGSPRSSHYSLLPDTLDLPLHNCGLAQARIDFMSDLLDEYDRFTGRQITGQTVSDEQWKQLAYVMTGVNA